MYPVLIRFEWLKIWPNDGSFFFAMLKFLVLIPQIITRVINVDEQ
jgi:hypothetical protein